MKLRGEIRRDKKANQINHLRPRTFNANVNGCSLPHHRSPLSFIAQSSNNPAFLFFSFCKTQLFLSLFLSLIFFFTKTHTPFFKLFSVFSNMAFDGFVSDHTKDMQTLALNEPLSVSSLAADVNPWERAKRKAEIMGHPMYDQLLEAHVACLRVATPVDQLARIDDQLSRSQEVLAKYSSAAAGAAADEELDHFMANYVLLLGIFKEQLQQHVRVHAMEAVMACWDLEQSLQSLTGVSPGEGTGATMSDDEEEVVDSDTNLFDGSFDGIDTMGFGPLVPSETERSLMERVRQELKHDLKQGYKEKIVDIREEILRKRRAGKLPGDTTSQLKAWWQSHSKWPYPTEEDKARLVEETGLQLKQINNWFINQRKRNWHNNPSTSLKSKRKK
ncbi:hypothetical protein DITRI_Ditri10aG0162100 [Diplodiscus trichospermus]